MGSALARHFGKKHALTLCDHDIKKSANLAAELNSLACEHLQEATQEVDVIVLAVKPKDLSHLATEIAPTLSEDQLIISVLAGTSLATDRAMNSLITS